MSGWRQLWAIAAVLSAGCRVDYDPTVDCSALVADAVLALGDTCFTRHDLVQSASAAIDACQALGGTLAGFRSMDENAGVVTGLQLREPTWLGLSFSAATGWQWDAGDAPLFANWASGEPAAPADGDRALLTPEGNWSVGDTTLLMPYICEVRPAPTVTFAGAKFALGDRQLPFDLAVIECESAGGHLATIHGGELHLALERFADSAPWIGLRRDANGPWGWVTGEAVDATFWGQGKPDSPAGSPACAYYELGWGSAGCGAFRDYLCEFE